MQFQVPQFIDVAPKIVGPLTLEQFLYLAGGLVPAFLLFFALQFWLWIIVAFILGGAGAAMAFVKINGQPLRRVGLSAFNYFWKPRLYLWQRVDEIVSLPELPKMPRLPEARPIPEEPTVTNLPEAAYVPARKVPELTQAPLPPKQITREPRKIQTEGKRPIEIRKILEKMVEVPTAPLKDLLLKMTTSKAPVPKREKATVKFLSEFAIPKEDFETIRKTAGDRGVAKRIDFR